MSDKLRPHHLLCIANFEGKGYSAEFTKNMTAVISRFEKENPLVEITLSADIICGKCPNCINEKCTGYKAEKYDSAVMNLLGLGEGSRYYWKSLRQKAYDEILKKNIISEICGDCQWSYICKNKNGSD